MNQISTTVKFLYSFSTLKAEALLFYAFSILTLCIFAMPKGVDDFFFAKKLFQLPQIKEMD